MQQLLWEVLQNVPGFGFILFSIIDKKKKKPNGLMFYTIFFFQLLF